MVDELFELLPADIKNHLIEYGHIDSFPHNLNNYLEFLGEGSDRAVFALNDDYVVKFEFQGGDDQNLQEYHTYQEDQVSETSTKIFANEKLLDMGLLFAERVVPMGDFFYELFGEKLYSKKKNIKVMDYIDDFDLSEHGIYFLVEKLTGWVDEEILEELEAFTSLAQLCGLQDMHSENIGVARDGRFLALDLGFGST